MIFIKIAGPLITDKNKPFSVNWKTLETVSHSIGEVKEDIIVGHGGGSFGHFIANEYAGQESGYFKIRESMMKLNTIVVSSLIAKEIPAVSFSPSNFMLMKGGKIEQTMFDQILTSIKKYVPVLHFDPILDRENGYELLSTEQILRELAKVIKPRKFLLATTGPLTIKGEKVDEIADWNFRDIVPNLDDKERLDIKGGIKEKVMELAHISAENDIECYVFDGSSPHAIKRAWKFGEGTRIRVSKVPSL